MTTMSLSYLSGPMTGIDDYNYPEFHRIAARLRHTGVPVVNPAEAYGGDQSLPFSEYMRHDITQLLTCDGIILMPGWENAVGCVFEVAVAAALGHSILEYKDEVGGYTLRSALPLFDTDRDRLGFVLGTPVHTPELAVGLEGLTTADAYMRGHAQGYEQAANLPTPIPLSVHEAYLRGVAAAQAAAERALHPLIDVPAPIVKPPSAIKAGDLVKVVKPQPAAKLWAGDVHKVERVTERYVFLAGGVVSDTAGWHHDRFELVETTGPIVVAPPAVGPEPMSTWAEADDGLLKAADHIVNGDRQRTYGHPIHHHTATAELWSAYLSRCSGERINVRPSDVSILMILDKVSRVGGGDKVDNVLDIAGYAQVHAKVRAAQS